MTRAVSDKIPTYFTSFQYLCRYSDVSLCLAVLYTNELVNKTLISSKSFFIKCANPAQQVVSHNIPISILQKRTVNGIHLIAQSRNSRFREMQFFMVHFLVWLPLPILALASNICSYCLICVGHLVIFMKNKIINIVKDKIK